MVMVVVVVGGGGGFVDGGDGEIILWIPKREEGGPNFRNFPQDYKTRSTVHRTHDFNVPLFQGRSQEGPCPPEVDGSPLLHQ